MSLTLVSRSFALSAVLAVAGCGRPGASPASTVRAPELPTLDDATVASIAELPEDSLALLDFERARDVPGFLGIRVVNEDDIALVISGRSATVGAAVFSEIPTTTAQAAAILSHGAPAWVVPSRPTYMRSLRGAENVSAEVDRYAVASDERGLAHAVIVTRGPDADVLHVYGRLTGLCESIRDATVRRVVAPAPGTLCAEVLAL